MKLKAYAKINLALGIEGTLDNGYHAVDMLMQTISLHDLIDVEEAGGIELVCPSYCGPDHKNTAIRAAGLFFGHTGIAGGARITIVKNIPSQAGLGGGSSDGAAVLHALNCIYGAGLSDGELCKIAVKIGADTPFFIRGGCMRSQGIGDALTNVNNKCDVKYLLIKPEGGVDTAAAYKLYDELPRSSVDIPLLAERLERGDSGAYFASAENALYPAAKKLCPQIDVVIGQAYELGADFAMMTGSGSCVFAVFEDSLHGRAELFFKKRYPFVATAVNTGSGNAPG